MRPWPISAATSRKRRRLRRMLTATSSGEHRQHEVDAGGDADLARLPIGPADRGVEELRGGVGRGQHPAAARRLDRDDRGQQLDRAVGLACSGSRWRHPTCRRRAGACRMPRWRELVELGARPRRRGSAAPRPRSRSALACGLARRRGRLQHQLQHGAVAGVLGELGVEGDLGAGLDVRAAPAPARRPISLLRSWMARVTRSRICRSALSNWP